MAFFAISFVFISCSNDDDDNTEVTTTSKNVYSIDADLSCYITAMGGQEFGKPVYKSTNIIKNDDDTYTCYLNLGTGTGTILAVDFTAFIDATNSTPGYYNSDGEKLDADYVLSKTETALACANSNLGTKASYANYVTQMSFPVTKDVSEYTLYLYVNSNIMGVQFCDGTGTSTSNHPDETTPYKATLTLDWDTLASSSDTIDTFSISDAVGTYRGTFNESDLVLTVTEDDFYVFSDGLEAYYAKESWTKYDDGSLVLVENVSGSEKVSVEFTQASDGSVSTVLTDNENSITSGTLSYSKKYTMSDLSGTSYSFSTVSASTITTTFTFVSESEANLDTLVTMNGIVILKQRYYCTYTAEQNGDSFLVTFYKHDEFGTPADTTGDSLNIFLFTIIDPKEKIGLYYNGIVEATLVDRTGNYWGTWSLNDTDYPMWVGVTKDAFSWAAEGYGTGTTTYEYVKWSFDDDGNIVFNGYPTKERYTADNPAATVTFTISSILFDVPAMASSSYVSNYESAELTAGDAYEDQYEAYASYWGEYTGTLTVMNSDYDITVTVANNSFSYSSTSMSGEYTNINWVSETSGRTVTKWTLSGYADSDTAQETAKIILEIDLSGDEPVYTFTVNVSAMGTPSTTLTKASE